ncbi:Uma2 family endonuclease [Myxococcus sp. 1LA]
MAYGARKQEGPATLADNQRIGIQHLWFIDLEVRTLSVHRLVGGRWTELGVYGEEDTLIRVEPFEDVELRLGWLWQSIRDSR